MAKLRPGFRKALIFSLMLCSFNLTLNYCEPTYTYVKEINIAPPLKEKIASYLKDKDAETGGLFSRQGIRPITIKLGPLENWKLAETGMFPWGAEIVLNEKIRWERNSWRLETTVLHELGHAFGIWRHDPDPHNIMYYAESPMVDDSSITEFLAMLKRKGHLW